ncbi:MAG: DNA polymerase III subunit alpha [Patescibacteria group bacterium]
MAEQSFVHLHLHSEYSMLDGLIKLKELGAKAKEFGMSSVALTDHGVMHGVVEFAKVAKENELKPIFGVETYVAKDYRSREGSIRKNDDEDKLYYHLTLLAKNFTGYKNLLKLVSIANTEGFYYKPRIDKELLKQHSEGLLALSGCYGGEIPGAFWSNRNNPEAGMKKAMGLVEEYGSIFGDDFYIEIQRKTSDQASQDFMDPLLIDLAKRVNRKLVASGDVHYLLHEDAKIQDIFWAIQEGRTIYDPKHKPMHTDQLYFKSPAEMYELFSDVPDAPFNTNEVAEKIEKYSIFFDRVQPKYPDVPDGMTAGDLLREHAYQGANERYGEITDATRERLEYELKIIHDKGYDDYFLIVADYIRWARSQGIIVGPGRGSGAGSVVAYTTRITDIDPFWWGLQFERFLNPYRPSPPDFDIDFQDDRRDEVIRYIEQKYGHDNVSAICAIGRMDTKAAIRDVSRALAIPLDQADKVAKMIPVKRGKPMPIAEAMESMPEFRSYVEADPKLVQMVEAVKRIKKIARNVSVHACGYVITPNPIVEYVPERRAPQNTDLVITQIEGAYLEDVGLMKYDFLGLRTLTVLKNAENAINKQHGIVIDWEKQPIDDKKAYVLFQKALTDGIFQFESQGMKKYLVELVPENILDICFMCAAYRPGPMAYIPDYIERKHGRKKIEYLHPDMEVLLKETMGYAIYQEQVMAIAVAMAGYTIGEADLLRRAMGKKKKEILDQEKPKFFEGMAKKGYTQELAEQVFSYLLPFADYGFNKSHSACYAVVAYRTAYLKAHHPIEFIVGLMQADMGHADKLEGDLAQAVSMHIQVLPPHINQSNLEFSIEYHNDELETKWLDDNFAEELEKLKAKGEYHYIGSIRYGLKGIKGASQKALEAIIEERGKGGEFKHLDDLISRVDLDRVDKKTLLILAQAGALNDWGERNALITLIPVLYDRYKAGTKKDNVEQISMFAFGGEQKQELIQQTAMPQVEPVSIMQILKWEKDLFGIYLSSHPLHQYTDYFMSIGAKSLDEAIAELPSEEIFIGAQISRMKKLNTKNGDMMAFLDLEDTTSQVSAVLFPRTYQQFAKLLLEKADALNEAFVFKGRIDKRLDKVSFVISNFELVSPDATAKKTHQVTAIKIKLLPKLSREDLDSLKAFIAAHPGDVKLSFELPAAQGTKIVAYKGGISYSFEIKKTLKRFGDVFESGQ